MKNAVVLILIFLCLALGVLYLFTSTPLLVNLTLPQFVNDHAKGFRIESFSCSSQKSRLPNILEIGGLDMILKVNQEHVRIQAEKMIIHNFYEFIKNHNELRLSGYGVDISTDDFSAGKVKFKSLVRLKEWGFTYTETGWFAEMLRFGPYMFTSIDGRLKAGPKKIDIFEVEGNAYDGSINGQLTFEFKPEFSYVFWAELDGISSQAISYPYPQFFSAIRGNLNATVRIVGGETADIFSVIFQGQKGIKISPQAFLTMKGAFDDEEEQQLRQLAAKGAALDADRATLHIQNGRADEIMMIFDIQETAEKLILKGRYAIPWAAGYGSFLFPAQE